MISNQRPGGSAARQGGRTLAPWWFVGLTMVPLGAGAQATPDAPTAIADPDVARQYRELVDRALDEFKHKNWQEARVLFRRAHELSPTARTLRGLGVVSYEMRDYVEAILALSDALADNRQPLTEAQRRECETLLTRSRTFVGRYALSLEPEDARVRLDAQPLTKDRDGRVLVAFGEHTLQVSAPGYQESVSRLVVQGGEEGELRIVLYRPVPLAAAPASKVEKSVEVPPPAPAKEERRFIGGGFKYTWVTLGASAAFGATSAALWFAGQRKVDDLESECDAARSAGRSCVRGEVAVDQVTRFERASSAMLGLSAAALASTFVLAALEWPRERQAALALAGPHLTLRGTF